MTLHGYERQRRERALTIAITLLCLGFSAAAFWRFYADLNATLSKLNAHPVATVLLKNRIAQRHFEGHLVWDQLRTGSPIYSGDTVRTADLSDIEFLFKDKQSVNLGENTMVSVSADKAGTHITVTGGTVTASTARGGKALDIEIGGHSLEVTDGASVTAALGPEDKVNVKVNAGKLALATADGERVLGENDSISADADGAVRPAPSVTPILPASGAVYHAADNAGARVSFAWQARNFAEPAGGTLEVATDRRFTNIVFSHTLRDIRAGSMKSAPTGASKKAASDALIAPGKWWWRVRSGAINIPAISTFTVKAPPRVAQAKQAETADLAGQLAASYRFTIRPLDEGKPLWEFDERAKNNAKVAPLPPGTYRWDIEDVNNPTNNNASKQTRRFEVTEVPVPPAPTLTAPSAGAVFDSARLARNRAITFRWQAAKGADSYLLSLRKREFGSNAEREVMLPALVKKTTWTMDDITVFGEGVYYWQVESASSAGGLGLNIGKEAHRTFTVRLAPPAPPEVIK
jgi:hypothetical protein